MLKVELIGNLGADAEVKTADGNKFITFRVADSYKVTTSDGKEQFNTNWVDCIISNVDSKVFPYLKSGVKVFVRGNGHTRVYSSKKDRMMKAGLTINVTEIELCGGTTDIVPRQLIDPSTARVIDVQKFYWIPESKPGMAKTFTKEYVDKQGQLFYMNYKGFVTPAEMVEEAKQGANKTADEQVQSDAQQGDEQVNEQAASTTKEKEGGDK